MPTFRTVVPAFLVLAIILASPFIIATPIGVQAVQPPDFSMVPPWTVATFLQGTFNSSNWLQITSIGGFTRTVYLSSSSTFPSNAPIVALYQTTVVLSSGGTGSAQFSVSVGTNTTPGNYTTWITGASNTASHYVQLTIIVKAAPSPPPDFNIGANPSSLSIQVSTISSSAIGLYGSSGYNGDISLTATPFPSSLSATLNPRVVRLSGSQFATSTLTLQGMSPGYYTVNINATDGTNAHSIRIDVQVYTQQIMPGPSSLLYSLGYKGLPYPGGSTIFVNNFTDLGLSQIKITSVTISTDFGTFTPNGTPLTLYAGQQTTLQLPISIPQSTSVGNHTVTATVNWESSNSSSWINGAPIYVSGVLRVYPSPASSTSPTTDPINSFYSRLGAGAMPILLGFIAYLMLASVGTVLFARHEQRRRLQVSS